MSVLRNVVISFSRISNLLNPAHFHIRYAGMESVWVVKMFYNILLSRWSKHTKLDLRWCSALRYWSLVQHKGTPLSPFTILYVTPLVRRASILICLNSVSPHKHFIALWKKCCMKCGIWNQVKIWSSHLLDNLSNCLMNLKNSGDSTGFDAPASQRSWVRIPLSHLNFSGSWDNCLNCPVSARIISSLDFKYRTSCNISFILHSFHGKTWAQQIDLLSTVWLHSSVG